MKRLLTVILVLVAVSSGFSQEGTTANRKPYYFVKGGFGTSWIILPKVFLVNPTPPNDNGQILPAINGFSGFVGFQTVIPMGKTGGWLFAPELDVSYISGDVRMDLTYYPDPSKNRPDTIISSEQGLQSYVRVEVPLHFGVRSSDNFWVSFGPSLYFSLYDNNGFEEVVFASPVSPDLQLKVKDTFGVRFRLAAYASVGKRGYIDIKFESDLGQYFRYENSTYDVRFSFQNLSIGYGYRLN